MVVYKETIIPDSGLIETGTDDLQMNECEKQANQRGLGRIISAGLLLFAFLIALPFVSPSAASTTHFHAEMGGKGTPQGGDSLPIAAANATHDHDAMSKTQASPESHETAVCAPLGHVVHGSHICCFQNLNAVQTTLRRDSSFVKKPVFFSFPQVSSGLVIGAERSLFAIELGLSQSEFPQLVGLIGAGAEFLRTQRLLT